MYEQAEYEIIEDYIKSLAAGHYEEPLPSCMYGYTTHEEMLSYILKPDAFYKPYALREWSEHEICQLINEGKGGQFSIISVIGAIAAGGYLTLKFNPLLYAKVVGYTVLAGKTLGVGLVGVGAVIGYRYLRNKKVEG